LGRIEGRFFPVCNINYINERIRSQEKNALNFWRVLHFPPGLSLHLRPELILVNSAWFAWILLERLYIGSRFLRMGGRPADRGGLISGQPLACKKSDTAYRNGQDGSPRQIDDCDEKRPILHGSEIGQVIGRVGDEPKQGRAQDGCFE
jgi:hypothetical protein